MDINSEIERILKLPYGRTIYPEEDGSFFGTIADFPGCFSCEDTAAEALKSLEEVAHDWLDAAMAQGQSIPPPSAKWFS